MKIGLAILTCFLLLGCASSKSLIEGGGVHVGMSKAQLKDSFAAISFADDPFFSGDTSYYPNINSEILWSDSRRYYFVFKNVTSPYVSYNEIGNGALVAYESNYDQALALLFPPSVPPRTVAESRALPLSENVQNAEEIEEVEINSTGIEEVESFRLVESRDYIRELPEGNIAIRAIRYEKGDGVLNQISVQSNILFDYDKDKITPQAEQAIAEIFSNFREELNSKTVLVVGHTDSDGESQYNTGLSARRALNVAKVLGDLGVVNSSMLLIPAGEHMPLVSNDSPANMALNRRVEIFISDPRSLAFEFLREWKCPSPSCDYAEVSILGVSREFQLENIEDGLSIPNSIVLMENEYQERLLNGQSEERIALPMPIKIRNFSIETNRRTFRSIKEEGVIDNNDPVWRDLINRIE